MNVPVSCYDNASQEGWHYCPRCDAIIPRGLEVDECEGVRGYCPDCKKSGHASELFSLPYARSEGYVTLVKDPPHKMPKKGAARARRVKAGAP